MNLKGRSLRRLLIACGVVFASGAAAAAQPAPPPSGPPSGPPPPGWEHPGDHRLGPPDWQAERPKMEERRLAELHTKLNLRPGQEPAWQAFVTGLQAARPTPKAPRGAGGEAYGRERPEWDKMKMETTPERLDHMLARIDAMRAHLAQMDQTVKAFYAGLSKDQQTIFDDNFRFVGHGRGDPGGWEHGMGHDRMGHGPMGHDPMEHGPMEHDPMGHGPMGPPEGPGAMSGAPPQD